MAVDARITNTNQGPSVVLRTERLFKSFGGVRAVNDLSFEACQGKVLALVGPNGSGKTTVFDLISGLQQPDSGGVYFDGLLLTGRSPSAISQLGIARTFQNIRLFPQMTALDNTRVAFKHRYGERLIQAFLRTMLMRAEQEIHSEAALQCLREVSLVDKQHVLAGCLSHGQRRMLEIVRAIAMSPKLLLLDEPLAGLSPDAINVVRQLILGQKRKSCAVVLIEHNVDIALEVSDMIIVMDAGKVVAEGTPERIRNSGLLIRAFMGKTVNLQQR